MLFEITFKEGFKGGITDNNGVASHANLTSADSNMLTYMKEKEWEWDINNYISIMVHSAYHFTQRTGTCE